MLNSLCSSWLRAFKRRSNAIEKPSPTSQRVSDIWVQYGSRPRTSSLLTLGQAFACLHGSRLRFLHRLYLLQDHQIPLLTFFSWFSELRLRFRNVRGRRPEYRCHTVTSISSVEWKDERRSQRKLWLRYLLGGVRERRIAEIAAKLLSLLPCPLCRCLVEFSLYLPTLQNGSCMWCQGCSYFCFNDCAAWNTNQRRKLRSPSSGFGSTTKWRNQVLILTRSITTDSNTSAIEKTWRKETENGKLNRYKLLSFLWPREIISGTSLPNFQRELGNEWLSWYVKSIGDIILQEKDWYKNVDKQ